METILFAYTLKTPKRKDFLQIFKTIFLLTQRFIASKIEQLLIPSEKTAVTFNY